MRTDQEGLVLLTTISCIVSLLCSFVIIFTCFLSKLYKQGSIRLLMYLSSANLLSAAVLMMPTSEYTFMCSFQSHILNFLIISELFIGCLFMHYNFRKIIQEKRLTSALETRYIGFTFTIALILSIPPIFSERFIDNCWEYPHSPLSIVASSFIFLIPFTVGIIVNYGIFLAIIVHVKLNFSKGFHSEEYLAKIKGLKEIGKFSIFIYLFYSVIAIYAVLVMLNVKNAEFFAYFAMACKQGGGCLNLVLFLRGKKFKNRMFKGKMVKDKREPDSLDSVLVIPVTRSNL